MNSYKLHSLKTISYKNSLNFNQIQKLQGTYTYFQHQIHLTTNTYFQHRIMAHEHMLIQPIQKDANNEIVSIHIM